ncbi:helix-turn-helix domain-containing protein [Amycolatopsis sp. NPDC059657]|uniref:nSTAND1 domain-containing NTPase n=1 Tax=Amycolatopsis sp. NPDC059657 TaxID=3346899 RepID=UPI00366C4004
MNGSPLAEFAADLRHLREQAGSPPYRELAQRAGFAPSTLSDAAGGRRLPSLKVTLGYVQACGGDTDSWEQRWHALAADLSTVASPDEDDGADAPFMGLRAYNTADAEWFFGRERLVDDLVGRLQRQRFLAVFGLSGAGKSSILRAGLIPRLTGPVAAFTPGAHPLDALAGQLAALSGSAEADVRAELTATGALRWLLAHADAEVVLVVDQFEELFTLCHDESERAQFIKALLTATTDPVTRCRVVLGVRADFYTHCTLNADLAVALQDAQITVGPMTTDELRRAITHPTRQADCTIESALLTTLIAQANGQAGVLPLLSHTLLATWRRRQGNRLSLAGYIATGGIDAALAQTAEAIFSSLSEHEQHIARDLFQRLTALGEGTEDTKRRISLNEVDTTPAVHAVVEQLTNARLITRDHDSLELTHESLIKAWPRLTRWLATDREGQRLHRELTNATTTWEQHDRDPGTLLRGTRLALLHDWATNSRNLSAAERIFVDTSAATEERERAAKTRRTRRRRQLTSLFVIVVLLAGGAIFYAISAEKVATQQRTTAQILQVIKDMPELNRTNPALAAQLSLAIHQLQPSAVTNDVLTSAAAAISPTTLARGPAAVGPNNYALAQNGQVLLVSNPFQIWIRSENQMSLAYSGKTISEVSINRDGKIAATRDGTKVTIWNLTDPFKPRERDTIDIGDHPGRIHLSPNGNILTTPSRTAISQFASKFWNISESASARQIGEIESAHVIALSDSTATVSLGSWSSSLTEHVQLWNFDQGSLHAAGRLPDTGTLGRYNMTMTPGTPSLATTSSEPNKTIIWDIVNPDHPREIGALELDSSPANVISGTEYTLAMQTGGGQIAIRDLKNLSALPRHTLDFPRQTGDLISLAYESENRALIGVAAINPDSTLTVYRWPLISNEAAAVVCKAKTTTITTSDWSRYLPGIPYRRPCG